MVPSILALIRYVEMWDPQHRLLAEQLGTHVAVREKVYWYHEDTLEDVSHIIQMK